MAIPRTAPLRSRLCAFLTPPVDSRSSRARYFTSRRRRHSRAAALASHSKAPLPCADDCGDNWQPSWSSFFLVGVTTGVSVEVCTGVGVKVGGVSQLHTQELNVW